MNWSWSMPLVPQVTPDVFHQKVPIAITSVECRLKISHPIGKIAHGLLIWARGQAFIFEFRLASATRLVIALMVEK